ncbi:MAG: glycosyltransferase family 2 protein [Chloroflexota bacterium]|nr:MAG: glycosyltransferase family 2 protein [Chloroflexota bacterium]
MPIVSVVVPCYNEEATIRLLLEGLNRQTFPRQDMEVIIADGLSVDRTCQEIAGFQQEHPELSVNIVRNDKRTIPSGLNRAIEAARGEFIIRLDAHSVPYPDYIARCVSILQEGQAEIVGGIWEIRPAGKGWIARSIAAAAAHPLGVGDAHYRYTDRARQADTVPFGAFRRSLIARIGGFDETLLTNEDYEFNVRVRKNQGVIWLDPSIRSTYFARSTLPALARQYWRYGFWKGRMLRRYPETLRWRQAIPPIFVLSLAGLGLLAFVSPLGRAALAAEILLYSAVLLLVSTRLAYQKKDFALAAGVPLAIATMHIFWGAAISWSFIRSIFTNR